ncbi:MAG TPA: hypothetical protein VKU41_17355, partial [Polyangiaceae bacterium]|nr:hypothetical protein [Polyangiaceae bacterium]
ERIPQVESGAVSLDAPACGKADRLVCATGGTPIRVGKRNVGQGDYRVVVSDTLGLKGTVEALVRPTVPPTILPSGAADTCATAIDASSGGYFTGDTSTTQPTYSSGCDSPDSPGAPDQVLSLSLTQAQRLVIDMEGSTYTTMLDIHQGPSCPGTPVPNACYVGFGMARSFLDLELQAGQYWVIIAGYSGAKGPWSADVRVLPP